MRLRLRLPTVATMLAALLAVPACAPRPPPAPIPIGDPQVAASRLRQVYGQARDVIVELNVLADPPAGDGRALLFSLTAWAPWDGRVRLALSKLNVRFLDALIAPDGSFEAMLHQQQRVVRGTLREFDQALQGGGAFFTQIRAFVDEFRSGPVPARTGYRAGILETQVDGQTWQRPWLEADLDRGLAVRLLLDHRLERVETKELRRGAQVLHTLTYAKEQEPERGLRRAGFLTLAVTEDPTAYSIRLRRLTAPATIPERELTLNAPFAWTRISVAEFAALLVE